MSLIEHEGDFVDNKELCNLKDVCQIRISESDRPLNATSSSNLMCISKKCGLLFIAINNYLIMIALKEIINAAEKINFNFNNIIDSVKKRVLELPFCIHTIFLNPIESQIGLFSVADIENTNNHTFYIYNINELLSFQTNLESNNIYMDKVNFVEFISNLKADSKIICLEMMESIGDSSYFRFVVIYKSIDPFELFWDTSLRKYNVKQFCSLGNITTISVNPLNNFLYVGLSDGKLLVVESIQQIENPTKIQNLPPLLESQSFEVSSIQCLNESDIVVNYMGIVNNDYRPSCTVIYTENLTKANIFQDMFYFVDCDDDEPMDPPLYKAVVINSLSSTLIVFCSLSPDIEFVTGNSNTNNDYNKILFADTEKFTCPVTKDFKQTTVLATCSLTLDYSLSVSINEKNDSNFKPSSDFIIMFTSDGILGVIALESISKDPKEIQILNLSDCITIESNMEDPLYRNVCIENEKQTNLVPTLTVSTSLIEKESKIFEELPNNGIELVEPNSESLIDLKCWKPHDFVPVAFHSESSKILIDRVTRPPFYISRDTTNKICLDSVLEMLQPLPTFCDIMDKTDKLCNKFTSFETMIENDFLELNAKINQQIKGNEKELEEIFEQVKVFLDCRFKMDYYHKLSDVAEARLSLISLDEFSDYNTFHSQNILLLDKIIQVQQKLQNLLPSVKTAYEKLIHKPKNIVCSMNKLEVHTIQHLNNMIDSIKTKRKTLLDRIIHLSSKTNSFVDINIDNVYRDCVKRKLKKHVTRHIKYEEDDDFDICDKGDFFASIENYHNSRMRTKSRSHGKSKCSSGNKMRDLSTSIFNLSDKLCHTSTPQSNRRPLRTRLDNNIGNEIFYYSIDPVHYGLGDLNECKGISSDLQPLDCLTGFNNISHDTFTNNCLSIMNEWDEFINKIESINMECASTEELIDDLLNDNENIKDNETNIETIYDLSIFELFKEDVLNLFNDPNLSTKSTSIEVIQKAISEYWYYKQLIDYCDKENLKYDPTSVEYIRPEENILKCFDKLKLPCKKYIPKFERQIPVLFSDHKNASTGDKDKLNSDGERTESSVIKNDATIEGMPEKDKELQEGINLKDVKVVSKILDSDSSDCFDLTEIYHNDDLPLFLPLRLRKEAITDHLTSGDCLEDVDRTFGFNKWISSNPKYKNNSLPSSCFNPSLFAPTMNKNTGSSRESLFGPKTDCLDGASSTKLSTNNDPLSKNSFSNNNTTVNNKNNDTSWNNGSRPLQNIFSTNQTSTTNTKLGTNNLFGLGSASSSANNTNIFSSAATTNIFSSNINTRNNTNNNLFSNIHSSVNHTQNDAACVFGKTPIMYDNRNENDEDEDNWLGSLSRNTNKTTIPPLNNNSSLSANVNQSLMSTPYNQNSCSLLNFDAYNPKMKFNINISSSNDQSKAGNKFTFGSNDIVFSNAQPSNSSGVMPSMLSNSQQQRSAISSTTPSNNVFSNALKNFDANPKFLNGK